MTKASGNPLLQAQNMFTAMSVPLLRLTRFKQAELKEQGRRFPAVYHEEPAMDDCNATAPVSGNTTEVSTSFCFPPFTFESG